MIEFPDVSGLTEQQFRLLLLYELVELRAELRAASSLLLRQTGAGSEEFGKQIDLAQDHVIAEIAEHVKIFSKPSSRPPLN